MFNLNQVHIFPFKFVDFPLSLKIILTTHFSACEKSRWCLIRYNGKYPTNGYLDSGILVRTCICLWYAAAFHLPYIYLYLISSINIPIYFKFENAHISNFYFNKNYASALPHAEAQWPWRTRKRVDSSHESVARFTLHQQLEYIYKPFKSHNRLYHFLLKGSKHSRKGKNVLHPSVKHVLASAWILVR